MKSVFPTSSTPISVLFHNQLFSKQATARAPPPTQLALQQRSKCTGWKQSTVVSIVSHPCRWSNAWNFVLNSSFLIGGVSLKLKWYKEPILGNHYMWNYDVVVRAIHIKSLIFLRRVGSWDWLTNILSEFLDYDTFGANEQYYATQ